MLSTTPSKGKIPIKAYKSSRSEFANRNEFLELCMREEDFRRYSMITCDVPRSEVGASSGQTDASAIDELHNSHADLCSPHAAPMHPLLLRPEGRSCSGEAR
jgi:hypothetical protein